MHKTGHHIHTIRHIRHLWPVFIALAFVLFPFDWLEHIWPLYGRIFDVVFATVLAHHIGHSTLFFLASFPILLAFPGLLQHPLRYLTLMLLLAVGEEALQSLFKQHLPNIGDTRDLLFDLLGTTIAYIVMRSWMWFYRTRIKIAREGTSGVSQKED